MKFTCDSCGAAYMISDEKVGPNGVKVRCKKCGNQITVRRADEAPRRRCSSASRRRPPAGLDEELGSAFDNAFGDSKRPRRPRPGRPGARGTPAAGAGGPDRPGVVRRHRRGAGRPAAAPRGEEALGGRRHRPRLAGLAPRHGRVGAALGRARAGRLPGTGAAAERARPPRRPPRSSPHRPRARCRRRRARRRPHPTWSGSRPGPARWPRWPTRRWRRALRRRPPRPAARRSVMEQLPDSGGVDPTGAIPLAHQGHGADRRAAGAPLLGGPGRRGAAPQADRPDRGAGGRAGGGRRRRRRLRLDPVRRQAGRDHASGHGAGGGPAPCAAASRHAGPSRPGAERPLRRPTRWPPAPATPAPAGRPRRAGAKAADVAPSEEGEGPSRRRRPARPARPPVAQAAPATPAAKPAAETPAGKKKDGLLDFDQGGDDDLAAALGSGSGGRKVYVPPAAGTATAAPDRLSDGQIMESVKLHSDGPAPLRLRAAGPRARREGDDQGGLGHPARRRRPRTCAASRPSTPRASSPSA